MTERTAPVPVLDARDVAVEYRDARGKRFRAVDGVSLAVADGETLGLVGESGCGKSTFGRAILRLVDVVHGSIALEGQDITHLSQGAMRPLRRRAQMVFQDPYASLNPRMRVLDLVGEALDIHGLAATKEERTKRVLELLGRVGLGDEVAPKYAHELSGGMRQRVGIARALAVEPKLLVCDEPVSALDASVRAQVVNLLADLRDSLGLTLIFIAHDLAVVRHLSTRVAVMYLGKIVELGPADVLFEAPQHPYTRLLLASAPSIHPREKPAPPGDISAHASDGGCAFRPRCPEATDDCAKAEPHLVRIGAVDVACFARAKR